MYNNIIVLYNIMSGIVLRVCERAHLRSLHRHAHTHTKTARAHIRTHARTHTHSHNPLGKIIFGNPRQTI